LILDSQFSKRVPFIQLAVRHRILIVFNSMFMGNVVGAAQYVCEGWLTHTQQPLTFKGLCTGNEGFSKRTAMCVCIAQKAPQPVARDTVVCV
jgi:hypothetical protein